MTSEQINEAYHDIQNRIADYGQSMQPDEWREFVEELDSHVSSLLECIREEDAEQNEQQ